jgi:hypothetical protein
MKRLAYLSLIGLCLTTTAAHADIYQWEYINPVDPSQGKRQSATLAPDGAGVDAVPGAMLTSRDLTKAYLIEANLSGAYFSNPFPQFLYDTNLTSADLSRANLSNAGFRRANLTNANLREANLTNADFAAVDVIDTPCNCGGGQEAVLAGVILWARCSRRITATPVAPADRRFDWLTPDLRQ